jgi:hypothetical protein
MLGGSGTFGDRPVSLQGQVKDEVQTYHAAMLQYPVDITVCIRRIVSKCCGVAIVLLKADLERWVAVNFPGDSVPILQDMLPIFD